MTTVAACQNRGKKRVPDLHAPVTNPLSAKPEKKSGPVSNTQGRLYPI